MSALAILAATGFLFLKTGEKFATQEAAGPTVAALTAHLAGGYEPHVFNDPAQAIQYIVKSKPAAGIVTPGFYLTYAKALGMTPILEVKREKATVELEVLVAKKSVSLEAIKTVATLLAAEPIYVRRVVLQDKLGDELHLQPTSDVEGAVFDLADGVKTAADAVLMEAATWRVLSADAELKSRMKVIFTSDDLPGNLVVTFPAQSDIAKLKSELMALPPEVLNSIRVEAFADIDAVRLKKAEERFYGK